MGVLTIRNVDDEVIAALTRRAEANGRSLEAEVRHLLVTHTGAWLGAMRDTGKIVGDIVSPAIGGAAPGAE